MYKLIIKPLFDYILALIAFIALLPLLFLILILLIILNKETPFFIQERTGRYGELFHLIKFKTMNNLRDEFGELKDDSERLTSIGKFIRHTSLDELPQLLNVLNGKMSLVGPRPLLPEYLPLYNVSQNRRHEVKPGITGWAQVNGRNAISWEEKFNFDIWYVDNISFLLDLKIIWITLSKVLRKEGINQQTDIPMEKFKGSK